MVREDPNQVNEQVQRQDEEVYGDDIEPKNPDDTLKEFIGNEPSEGKPLDIAGEIEHDEKDILHNPPDDVETNDEEKPQE